jgi:hypothetical protein
MIKTILKLLAGTVLLIATQACAPPGAPTPDLNAVYTAIAQTIVAMTQSAQPEVSITASEMPSPTSSPDLAPATQTPSTQTPFVTMTPISFFTSTPGLTFTPVAAQITVSVPTNCRTGPGVTYDRVGGLQVGEVAEVVGRHADRNYWVIRNPGRPSELCWLWGEYATVTGNTSGLPVMTPPPTPTPAPGFDAKYNSIESCTGTGWWVDIELENTGGITFQSIVMTVTDTVTSTVLSLYSDDFTNRNGCNETATEDNLPAGDELLVSSPVFTSNPSGHELRATITLCSNLGQSGTCATQSINFTP